MRLSLLILLPLLAPQAAMAESWRLAAYSNNSPQMAYFVDIDSVQRTGSKVTFRQQTIYERVSDTRDFDRSILTREVDCVANTTLMRDSSFYVTGRYLDTEKGPSSPTLAKDGSVLKRMLDTVCGRLDYYSPVVATPDTWVREKFLRGF